MNAMHIQKRLKPLLSPLGHAYGFALKLRRKAWESGLCTPFRTPCPCVSVGNISWGGTGKTPVVDWLLQWLTERHEKGAVLTRGYKACPDSVPFLVTAHDSPTKVGDEPLMLALKHPQASILVDPKRTRSATFALATLQPDCLILDDGFQHLAVARDCDLVLLHPDDLQSQWQNCLPAGSWRESADALHRATAFLIKSDTHVFKKLQPLIEQRLAVFNKPVFSFTLRPLGLCHLHELQPTTFLPAETISADYAFVSGIGDPSQALASITRFMGRPPTRHLFFPDHHAYTIEESTILASLNIPFVCTAKDAVKLRGILPVSARAWVFEVETCFENFLWTKKNFSVWWETHYSAMKDQKYSF